MTTFLLLHPSITSCCIAWLVWSSTDGASRPPMDEISTKLPCWPEERTNGMYSMIFHNSVITRSDPKAEFLAYVKIRPRWLHCGHVIADLTATGGRHICKGFLKCRKVEIRKIPVFVGEWKQEFFAQFKLKLSFVMWNDSQTPWKARSGDRIRTHSTKVSDGDTTLELPVSSQGTVVHTADMRS